MKKKISIGISLMLILVLFVACTQKSKPASTSTAGSGSSGLKIPDMTIGYIQAGPAPYYQASADGALAAIKKVGAKSVMLNSEDSPQKELSNVEDLVSKKVNAILLFTTNADTAQRAAQLCNSEKIPLIIIGSEASAGSGTVTSTVKADFILFGQTIGKYVATNFKNAKIGIVEGALGQGIAEPISKGFMDETGKESSISIVAQQATDWGRQTAMATAQDFITAHPDMNLVFVHNEDMAAGVVQGIKDAGMSDKISVLSTNGSPEGIDMIRQGTLLATANESPYQEGALAVKTAIDAIYGKSVPKNITTPTVLITKDNLNEVIPWSVDAVNMVDWGDYIK